MADGDIVLRDPRALRAVAHPTRLALLEHLQIEGAATATECGAALGISPAAASYHLRSLARFGLVEEAGGGRGRSRPWRARGTGFAFEPYADSRPAAQAAAELLGAHLVAQGDRATIAFVASESRLEPVWRRASHIANKTVAVTPEEALALVRAIEELVQPFLRSTRDDPPADARVMRLLLRLFPRDLPR